MITVGIASIPGRASQLIKTIQSLYDQVDKFYIYLDGYLDDPVGVYLMDKVYTMNSAGRSFGDAGKFFNVSKCEGYYLACDDDLIYAHDYVQKLITTIEEYHRTCVVSYHGRIMQATPIKGYYNKRDTAFKYHCLDHLDHDKFVQIAGTGTMGFHTDTFRGQLSINDFKHPNMADIWMGLKCQEMHIPQLCASHEVGLISHQKIDGFTIYNSYVRKAKRQTEAVNSRKWVLYTYNPKVIN